METQVGDRTHNFNHATRLSHRDYTRRSTRYGAGKSLLAHYLFSSECGWIPCGVIAIDSNHSLPYSSLNRRNLFPASSITVQVICIQPEIICLPPSHPTHRFSEEVSLTMPSLTNTVAGTLTFPLKETICIVLSFDCSTLWSTLTTHFLHSV